MNRQRKTMVAGGHPLTSQAAIEIMEEGGNAFDGVVAAGFTAAIAEQALTSLGGGGFLLARTSGGEEILFDFFSDTPGKGLAGNALDPHFFPVTISFSGSDQDFNIGLGSVAVPGNLKGFLHVHKRFGRLPLAKVLQPAVRAARDGVVLNHRQSQFMDLLHPIMTLSETGRSMYVKNGSYLQEGDMTHNPDLAGFLESLADDHGESFYNGSIASAIEADMAGGNGLLTARDLAEYQVIERRPLSLQYRGFTLLTNPPPSFGGTLIGATLKLMEALPFPEMDWGSNLHLASLTAIMEEIDLHRDETVFNPFKSADSWLTTAIGRLRKFSRGTTHISVSDGLGNHASMTTSNGEGSGYFVPGTGIMLNNMMGEDDLHPQGFHASPPGRRVSSMMSPSLLMSEAGVAMVIGSGGSKRIRTAIPQVLSNILDFGFDVQKAVDLPRIHWDGSVLQIEPGYERSAIEKLREYRQVNVWDERSVYFGGVHTISSGKPAGDPRRGGAARIGMHGCP